MILRLTQKCAKKIDSLDALNDLPRDENPYLDWSANLFRAQRVQYIIITNTTSLYSTIMYGRGITDNSDLIRGIKSTLRVFLEVDGNEFIYRRFIETDESPIMFAKSLNRAVTGSMNDLIAHARFHLEYGEISPWDVSFKLNEIPMSYLKYSNPKKVFRTMNLEKGTSK